MKIFCNVVISTLVVSSWMRVLLLLQLVGLVLLVVEAFHPSYQQRHNIISKNCIRQQRNNSIMIGFETKRIYNRSINMKGYMSNHEYLDDHDDDDNDDNYNIIIDNLTEDEKKIIIKEYFAKAFEYDGHNKPNDVHIILFNPNTDQEGAHTIQILGNNILLAFESAVECQRFSNHLKDINFFEPVPQQIKLNDLESYCKSINVDVQVVPKGSKLKPPSKKVFNLDMNPNLQKEMELLDYIFDISESDEDRKNSSGAWE